MSAHESSEVERYSRIFRIDPTTGAQARVGELAGDEVDQDELETLYGPGAYIVRAYVRGRRGHLRETRMVIGESQHQPPPPPSYAPRPSYPAPVAPYPAYAPAAPDPTGIMAVMLQMQQAQAQLWQQSQQQQQLMQQQMLQMMTQVMTTAMQRERQAPGLELVETLSALRGLTAESEAPASVADGKVIVHLGDRLIDVLDRLAHTREASGEASPPAAEPGPLDQVMAVVRSAVAPGAAPPEIYAPLLVHEMRRFDGLDREVLAQPAGSLAEMCVQVDPALAAHREALEAIERAVRGVLRQQESTHGQ